MAPGVRTYVVKRIASSRINAPRATSCFKIRPPSATSCLLKWKYGQRRSVYIRAGLAYVWPHKFTLSRVAAAAKATARRRLHKQCRLCAGTGMIWECYTTLILTAFYDPHERQIHLPICHWRARIPLIRRNCERCFFFRECTDLHLFYISHIPFSLR